MGNRYEALGLSITSDGPVGGVYTRGGATNLTLLGETKGIEHFTNWDSRISSLDVNGFERFESKYASKYLDYEFSAAKIKVCEDIAAVSYPNYTHINKTVWENVDGGLYQPYKYNTQVFYDMVFGNYGRLMDGYILPILNKFGLRLNPTEWANTNNLEGFYDNLFIVVEYDGYYTDANNLMHYEAAMDGEREVFRYDPPVRVNEIDETTVNNKTPGTFSFVDKNFVQNGNNSGDANIGHVVLYPSFPYIVGASRFYRDGIDDDPRYHTTQAEADIALMQDSPDGSVWPIGGPAEDQFLSNKYISGDLTYAFIGYRKVSLIKYNPAVECGRVDIYKRKSGPITSFTDLGVVTSNGHALKDGDMIKIVGALDEAHGASQFNGIKYIQVNDANTFTIYDDPDYTIRLDLSEVKASDIKWVLLGGEDGLGEQGWQFQKSLMSPDGQNGVEELVVGVAPLTPPSKEYTITPLMFNEAQTYSEILELDIGYGFVHPISGVGYWEAENFTDFYNSNIRVDTRYSRHKALWAGPEHYISGYRFGADIDLIKTSNTYSLIVGEPGPERLFRYKNENQYYNLPNKGLYGKAHLFSIDSGVDIFDSGSINASTGDSEIPAPPEISVGSTYTADFYVGSGTTTATSLNHNIVTQEKGLYNNFSFDGGYLFNDYWFGAMVYHLPEEYTEEFVIPDNAMFWSTALLEFGEQRAQTILIRAPYVCDFTPTNNVIGQLRGAFYAYVDNFGKAVGLDASTGSLIAVISSTVKTTQDTSPSSGFVHVFRKQLLNLLVAPNDFYDAAWVGTGTTTRATDSGGFYFTTTGTFYQSMATIPFQPITYTIDCKGRTSGAFLRIYIGSVGHRFGGWFNLDTGQWSTGSDVGGSGVRLSTSSLDLGDGWYRISISGYTNLSSVDTNMYIANAESSTVRDVSKTVYLANARFEDGTQTFHGIDRLGGDILQPLENRSTWNIHYNAAKRFAQCIVARDGKIFYGRSKPEVSTNNPVLPGFPGSSPPLYQSKIFHYEWNGSTYVLIGFIINPNDTDFLISPYSLNRKERELRDEIDDEPLFGDTQWYASDRFGDYFSYENNVLAANLLDIKNDLNTLHSEELTVKSLVDYINVYERIGDKWIYVSKISPTIDSNEARYSYQDLLYPSFNQSLRNLNNLSYIQTRSGSATWDMDLTNCFVVADHRIILKDPIGYAIFAKDWNVDILNNLIDTSGGDIVIPGEIKPQIPVFPYFSFLEKFVGYQTADHILHTKIESLHKYENSGVRTGGHPPRYELMMSYITDNSGGSTPVIPDVGLNRLEHSVPVYFLSVPNDIGTINNLFIRPSFSSPNLANIRMVIYRVDPRMTYFPNSDYINYQNGYLPSGDIPGDLYFVQKTPDGEYIFRNGAFDATSYHNSTIEIEPPFGKMLSPSSLLPNNTLEFVVSANDLSTFLKNGSQLQNTIREFQNFSVDLHDEEEITYNSKVEINDTLIIGFIFNVDQDIGYKIPTTGLSFSSSVFIDFLSSFVDNSIPNTVINGGAGYVLSDNIYKCVNSNVSSMFDENIYQTSSCRKLRYTNPVLGIGTSAAATHFDASGGLIYNGTFSSAYQLVSTDNFRILNLVDLDIRSNNIARSFDVQKLEYLPLYIQSNRSISTFDPNDPDSDNDTSLKLSIPVYFEDNEAVDLFLLNTGSDNGMELFIDSTGHSQDVDLTIFGSLMVNNNVNLYINNNEIEKDLTLYIRAPELLNNDLNLLISGPIMVYNDHFLHISVDDWEPITSDITLFMYGNTSNSFHDSSYLDLSIIGGLYDSLEGLMTLHIAPIGDVDSGVSNFMPLHIGYNETITPESNNLSISIYNDQLVEQNWIRSDGVTTLYLFSTHGQSQDMPLHISRRGPNGEEEYGQDLGLVLQNTEAIGGLELLISPTYFVDQSMDLFMSEAVGGEDRIVSLFTRGFTE